ncbi:Regulator of RNase E activity RraA [Rhizobiales bacterium GAS191]|nr:Regulator of RNase E activity RraA [Rhizobiales bacterium GAS191]
MRADDKLLSLMRSVDTPTICNALELVAGRRLGEGFTRKPVVAADPKLPPIVGYARTATIACSAPPRESADALTARRLAYYDYVAAQPGPAVVVIEDEDQQCGIGAFWGEVQVAIHRGLGVAGGITNGSIRDLGTMDADFQLLAGSVMPSHAHVHLTALDVTVHVLGMRVKPGDLVHGDRHGAVVVPPDMVEGLGHAIDLVARRERPVIDAAHRPGFNVESLRRAWSEMEKIVS